MQSVRDPAAPAYKLSPGRTATLPVPNRSAAYVPLELGPLGRRGLSACATTRFQPCHCFPRRAYHRYFCRTSLLLHRAVPICRVSGRVTRLGRAQFPTTRKGLEGPRGQLRPRSSGRILRRDLRHWRPWWTAKFSNCAHPLLRGTPEWSTSGA